MKIAYRIFIFIIGWLLLIYSSVVTAQNSSSLDLLKKDYPLLMEKFGDELKTQKANYLFAIDVSGTMNKYESIVVPAMSQFVESLTDGDNVNIIRFGTEAKVSLGGFSDITAETKTALKQYIQTLYKKDVDLYSNTDLNLLLEEINKQLQIQKNNLTFIFILTDFINDPAKGKALLSDQLCDTHRSHLKARAIGHSMYMYALQLPVTGNNHLGLFRKAIPEDFHFEEFSITSPTALKNWFDRKKAEISLDKFRAIVQRQKQDTQFSIDPKIDIDGNLQLDVKWKPNRLFETISLDEVQLLNANSNFSLDVSKQIPKTISEDKATIEVGKIRHTTIGFHPWKGQIEATGSFPTAYDSELDKLEIGKGDVVANAETNNLLFTFWLPLWLSALLLLLLIIYLWLVFRAASRNVQHKWKINGRISVEYRGRTILEYPVEGEREIGIGREGNPITVTAHNCDWQLKIYQKTFSCLRVWKKPQHKVTMSSGSGFTTSKGEYLPGDITTISKGDFIQVDDFTIFWGE